MGTLRAHKTGGYAKDGQAKRARHYYRCHACGGTIRKGEQYERLCGCPVHIGATFDPGPNCAVVEKE